MERHLSVRTAQRFNRYQRIQKLIHGPIDPKTGGGQEFHAFTASIR